MQDEPILVPINSVICCTVALSSTITVLTVSSNNFTFICRCFFLYSTSIWMTLKRDLMRFKRIEINEALIKEETR